MCGPAPPFAAGELSRFEASYSTPFCQEIHHVEETFLRHAFRGSALCLFACRRRPLARTRLAWRLAWPRLARRRLAWAVGRGWLAWPRPLLALAVRPMALGLLIVRATPGSFRVSLALFAGETASSLGQGRSAKTMLSRIHDWSCRASPRRNSRQAASSAISIYSSGWCAWSMRPGPQTTAAIPAR